MTEDDLKAIEARAAAATPGPWIPTARPEGEGSWPVFFLGTSCSDEDGTWNVFARNHKGTLTESGKDAKFIAAARADVPALLAEVRRLRSTIVREPPR